MTSTTNTKKMEGTDGGYEEEKIQIVLKKYEIY